LPFPAPSTHSRTRVATPHNTTTHRLLHGLTSCPCSRSMRHLPLASPPPPAPAARARRAVASREALPAARRRWESIEGELQRKKNVDEGEREKTKTQKQTLQTSSRRKCTPTPRRGGAKKHSRASTHTRHFATHVPRYPPPDRGRRRCGRGRHARSRSGRHTFFLRSCFTYWGVYAARVMPVHGCAVYGVAFGACG
jgi:hypothetical protein